MSRPLSIDMKLKVCVSLFFAAFISGCSTSKDELLPHGNDTMLNVWDQGTTGSGGNATNRQILDARSALRRPLEQDPRALADANRTFARTSQNEIYSQFKRLPNPDLVMYIFPHLAGFDPAPVPGYTTVFPLYQRVQYAMPGERTEDY
ncbi:MAG: TIGR03751 family conjugal transfer lipoprotein [Janthinobacterium lividum]